MGLSKLLGCTACGKDAQAGSPVAAQLAGSQSLGRREVSEKRVSFDLRDDVSIVSSASPQHVEVDHEVESDTSTAASMGDNRSEPARPRRTLRSVMLAVRAVVSFGKPQDLDDLTAAACTPKSRSPVVSKLSSRVSTRGSLRKLFSRKGSRMLAAELSMAKESEQIQQLMDMVKPGQPLSKFNDFTKSYCDEAFCRRLLRKYDGNVTKAGDKLKVALQWRADHEKLLTTREFKQGGDYRVLGADFQQRPMLYMCMGNQLCPGAQALDHQVVAQLQAIDNMPAGVEKSIHIWDLHDMSIRMNLNPAPLGEMVKATETYFAERLQELIIIDMPRMASFLKDAIWPLVPEKTRQKVKFMSAKEAKAYLHSACPEDTARRISDSIDQNRNSKMSLEQRRRSWMRVDEQGNVVPAFQ